MNILVTGSSGFLGSHLCKSLEDVGHNVLRLNSQNCDLTRDDSLIKFNHIRYDQIFHLAAWTQAGNFCLYHPGEQWLINQAINTNLLKWWQKYQSQAKCICIGTSCSYSPEDSMAEVNYLIGAPIDSLFTYAMTKRILLVGLQAIQKQYGLKYLYAVPSTLYGPGYHTDGRQMHFIFDLIRKILRGKLYNEPVILWGDGYQRRELVYIDDFIRILLELNITRENEIINIGAGEEFTIRHFAQIICDYVQFPMERIQFDTDAYVGAKSKCLDISKLKLLMPDLKYFPLEKGIAATVDWFLSERANVLPAK